MRRSLLTLLIIVSATFASAAGIAVFVDGKQVNFPVGQPMEFSGHVMVPLRGVFEQMGGTVNWDEAAQQVTIGRAGTTIKMTVGDAHALKNEETVVTNAKSILRGGTVYVPLRFLAETLDATVRWDGAQRAVHITTAGTIPAPSSQRKPPPPPAASR